MKLPADSLPTLPVAPQSQARHERGSHARVLLTSVFGPYAQDDEYGSRLINPMELYHNQVTRVQGPFSLRMFHRCWGLMLIQANIDRPLHAAGLPHAGPLHRRDPHPAITTWSAFPVDHSQRGQGEEDVRADPPLSAQGEDRHRRPHRQRPRPWQANRRRSHRPRRGRPLVPPLPGRGREPARPPPADHSPAWARATWASRSSDRPRRRGRHA